VKFSMVGSGQGLGFVIFGTVLDKRALKRLAVSIGSVLVTGIPLISALAKPPGYDLVEPVDRNLCAQIVFLAPISF
jgi:hypothetical protein